MAERRGKLQQVDVIAVTPFGVFCRECNIALRFAGGVTPHKHLAKVHGVTVDDEREFHQCLLYAIGLKRSTFVPSDYLDLSKEPPVVRFFCWKCSRNYGSLTTWQGHTSPGGEERCNRPSAQCDAVPCFRTVCGRLAPLDTIPQPSSYSRLPPPTFNLPRRLPPPPTIHFRTRHGGDLIHNYLASPGGTELNPDTLAHDLMPFVCNRAAVQQLVDSYWPFGSGRFDDQMSAYVRYQEVDDLGSSCGLAAMLAAMERHMKDQPYVSDACNNIVPLHQFEYPTPRPSLVTEGAKLVRFCWRIHSEAFLDIKQFVEQTGADPDVVFATRMFPLLMVRLAADQCHGYDEAPLLHRYCLALGFRREAHARKGLEMMALAAHASLVATALDLIHVGACLYLPFVIPTMQPAMIEAVHRGNATRRAHYLLQQLQVAVSVSSASSSSITSSSHTTGKAGSATREEDTQDGLRWWQHPAPEEVPAAFIRSKMETARGRARPVDLAPPAATKRPKDASKPTAKAATDVVEEGASSHGGKGFDQQASAIVGPAAFTRSKMETARGRPKPADLAPPATKTNDASKPTAKAATDVVEEGASSHRGSGVEQPASAIVPPGPRTERYYAWMLPDDDPDSPLSPPSHYEIEGGGYDIVTDYKTAQDKYNARLKEHSRKRNKYVPDCYHLLFADWCRTFDLSNGVNIDIVVYTDRNDLTKTSMIRGRCITDQKVKDAGIALGIQGGKQPANCRRSSMLVVGEESLDPYKLYKPTEAVETELQAFGPLIAKWLREHLPDELDAINGPQYEKGATPPAYMNGGPGGTVIMSKNLRNEAHFDSGDRSRSTACFFERIPKKAKNWAFRFINVSINGSRGVRFLLCDGALLSYHGNEVKHVTELLQELGFEVISINETEDRVEFVLDFNKPNSVHGILFSSLLKSKT